MRARRQIAPDEFHYRVVPSLAWRRNVEWSEGIQLSHVGLVQAEDRQNRQVSR